MQVSWTSAPPQMEVTSCRKALQICFLNTSKVSLSPVKQQVWVLKKSFRFPSRSKGLTFQCMLRLPHSLKAWGASKHESLAIRSQCLIWRVASSFTLPGLRSLLRHFKNWKLGLGGIAVSKLWCWFITVWYQFFIFLCLRDNDSERVVLLGTLYWWVTVWVNVFGHRA